ncbi:MAG: tRNA (adenine-N1)-methyltransferase [Candidatus Aenigmarchaeota archaeon]|nr:tRNA (adenine-N1)-methyltransferase [Candidatus Aenigmarchaeota archaeon]
MRKFVNEKDFVLLLAENEKYLVKVGNKKLNTNSGYINLKNLVGKKYGEKVTTHIGKKFVIVEPCLIDFMKKKLKRIPQIVSPKDASLILAYTGIRQNSVVLDAGSGSGFLAIFLAYYLPDGRIITYEKRKEYVEVVERNVKTLGLNNIEVRNRDIIEDGFDEKDIDLITLDMKDAEKVVKHAYKSLKHGGWLVIYSPYIEQVLKVKKEIQKRNFTDVKVVESIVREWKVEKYTRPSTLGIMHTGFLTFARKV